MTFSCRKTPRSDIPGSALCGQQRAPGVSPTSRGQWSRLTNSQKHRRPNTSTDERDAPMKRTLVRLRVKRREDMRKEEKRIEMMKRAVTKIQQGGGACLL